MSSKSRWGAAVAAHNAETNGANGSHSRSISPMPPPSGGDAGVCSIATNAGSKMPIIPFPDDEPDFQLIDGVEWNTDENASEFDELAVKPKPDFSSDDPCMCRYPYDAPDEGEEGWEKFKCCNDLSCVLFACQEECRSNCPAGEYCGNKRIQRRQWKQVEVIPAGKKGKGLIVKEDTKKGELISEYVGRAVNKHFLNRLFRRYANERKLYIMALDTNIYLDARKKGGLARYINHSCEPNCVVERWKVRGILRAAIVAIKDIPAGTELSFDYQWERKRGRAPTKCHCNAPKCRGTLEVPKSMEDEALERKLSNHWKKPLIMRAGKEIINRCIRIFSAETQEYYPADVTQYDESTGKHLVMYRHDLEEVWEDLRKENWMILDEEAEQFIIRKKVASTTSKGSTSLIASVPGPPGGGGPNDPNSSQTPLVGGPNLLLQQPSKNYVYVQTPVKEAMVAKQLIERCQRSCRVTITPQQFARPPLPPDPDDLEDLEKYAALQNTLDGTVWKLSIFGSDVAKAYNIITKNVAYLERAMMAASGELDGSGGGGGEGGRNDHSEPPTEVVVPRFVIEAVKKRMPVIREKCRSVQINFAPSESKSKQFARLLIEGSLQSDINAAKDVLWGQLNVACEEMAAPKTLSGVYKDLGFLGGELTSSDFYRLLEYDKTTSYKYSNNTQDAKEDLTRWSPFFASFEATQRCTIWVQSDSDKGRIDQQNRIVKEATPNAPRKIFFGCDPKIVPKLWNLVQLRASEVARGVKYLYLGPDRLYQPLMMRKGGEFFEYVRKVTGASVTVDSMTGDHLRIDGRGNSGKSASAPISIPSLSGEKFDLSAMPDTPPTTQEGGGTNDGVAAVPSPMILTNNPDLMTEGERASLAEEIIRLQIELYRDNCIRQQNWIFGRDWTLARRNTPQTNNGSDNGTGSSSGGASVAATGGASSRNLTLDPKTLSTACFEIADIISNLEITKFVSAHAAVILYRYATAMHITEQRGDVQLKIREIVVACAFIANKAQKNVRWKPLEEVLKAAYNVFYPGVDFDSSKEEVVVWEEKVMLAESEVLECLNYDVFYKGFDGIKKAATEAGTLDKNDVRTALSFSVSGPVLAAGSELWLTYGAEYIFAAAAGFLDAKMESLFIDLNLIPFKVLQAAEIIAESIQNTGLGKRQTSHPLFKEGKKGLLKHIPRIKVTCARSMSQGAFGTSSTAKKSETEQRYQIIGTMNRKRRIFRGVNSSIIKELILPSLDGICAESECSIFIEKDPVNEQWDIVLQGSWRALSIASFLLSESVKGKGNLTVPMDIAAIADAQGSIQAKVQPGLLEMKAIETLDGWTGTIQSQVSNQASWGRKTGGKCCVPGKIKESDLRQCGLRWWIPPRYGPSPNGSICDTFLVNGRENEVLDALASLALAFQGESPSFPMLTSSAKKQKASSNNGAIDRFVAVSLQRWPSEKVAAREQAKRKKAESSKSKSSSKERTMKIGFSASALQEIQLLNRLHGLIRSPQGHPNFVLPVGVALPSEAGDAETSLSLPGSKPFGVDLKSIDEDIFSLTRSSLENEAAAERERKRKDMITGPHFMFQATPFILQRFITKKKKREGAGTEQSISPRILVAWFHDMLSSLVHCHSNDIVLRNFSADQVMIDHSGVAKIGGLYRATVLSYDDKKRMTYTEVVNLSKSKKSKKINDDEILRDPYAPPEMILGYPKHTKETDVWMLGCLFCHILLGKPLYSGKDRKTIMQSLYKMIGTPSKENFQEGTKYPYFKQTRPEKKYKPGLAKALQYMMKEDSTKYASAIDLISRMLDLDPTKRITARGALQHDYMLDYVESCSTESFRKEFVGDWMLSKKRLMGGKTDDEEERERGIKRKAMLMAASKTSTTHDEDGLYDMDDLLGDEESSKKPKI